MNERIIIHLQGGLGNQLFQYAAALSVQKEVNTHSQIYCVIAENKHNRFHHDYVRDLFPELNKLEDAVTNHLSQYSQSNAFERWNPNLLPSDSILVLSGYFQYLPVIQEIIPLLQQKLLGRLLKVCRNPLILPNGSQSAFFHVRRGDYLNHPTYHWSQEIEYYKKGFQYIQKQNPFIFKWYIFSDDIDWCAEQEFFRNHGFEFIRETDEYQSLSLMIQCQGGAVIANSTFSWWGAMLGVEYCKKPVVYPLKWCGEETVILFPRGWHGI